MRQLTVTGLKARYKLSYRGMKAVQDWMKLARKVDSTQPDGETYKGAQGVKGPSERKGAAKWHTIPVEGFTLRNRDWDGAILINGKDWRHNKTADVPLKVKQLGTLMAVHPGQLMETLLTAGKATTGADGVFFFSASHPIGSSTMSNLLSGGVLNVASATWPTPAEWAKVLLYMATQAMLFTDNEDNEVNLGVSDFSVAVPAGLFPSLLIALAQQNIASGETNPLKAVSKFSYNPMLLPRWTETDELILGVNGQSSLIYQELEDPSDLQVLGPGTEYYIEENEVKGIARGSYNCGYDRWQGMVHGTLS